MKFTLFITVKTIVKLNPENSDKFEIKLSCSLDNAEFGHFTLFSCRWRQRKVPRITKHAHSSVLYCLLTWRQQAILPGNLIDWVTDGPTGRLTDKHNGQTGHRPTDRPNNLTIDSWTCRHHTLTFAWSRLIPIVWAVLLWRSVPSDFLPCSVIQPNAVLPT